MEWLLTLKKDTCIIVPTRGLQHSLREKYSQLQISKGVSVWHPPQILVWEDYINLLWSHNKHHLNIAYIRLNYDQALNVWCQIIRASKKSDTDLLLLNETQTAKIAQRSWNLAHRWQIDIDQISQDEDIDSKIFSQWCASYREKLLANQWIDPVQVESLLMDSAFVLYGLPKNLIFAYFDLLTSNQQSHIRSCKEKLIHVEDVSIRKDTSNLTENTQCLYYSNSIAEWESVLLKSRNILEENPAAKIGIVVPSLAKDREQIDQLARETFYPMLSPLQCQENELVFRFSIGQSLHSLPYIYSMLNSLELLKNTFPIQSFQYLIYSEWSSIKNFEGIEDLDRAIRKKRMSWLSWDEILNISIEALPDEKALLEKIQQLKGFQNAITSPESHDQAKTYSKTAKQWQSIFSQWLGLLDFPQNQLNSWHFQAHESWLEMCHIFVSLDMVQNEITLNTALQNINSLSKEKIFTKQAKQEPILISGVLEGIAHEVDFLFVTGMDETYPPTMPKDPFLPNYALNENGYPFADKQKTFVYEENKLDSLLAGGKNIFLSYASQQEGVEQTQSGLLSDFKFHAFAEKSVDQQLIQLEEYTDSLGLECLHSASITGGSKVFENQSQCPFKAYAEHRLETQETEHIEFGLESRDSGTLVHEILEKIWQELGTSTSLNRMEDEEIESFIEHYVEHYLELPNSRFQYHRKELLQLEKPRIKTLLLEWFFMEREHRTLPYSVVGIEQKMAVDYAGIPIQISIDRIDRTDSEDCIVIDYKTGLTAYSDWHGERLKSPQLPLYALALEQKMDLSIKGIAYGQVRLDDCEFKGVTEIEGLGLGFKNSLDRDKTLWSEQMSLWSENLHHLAQEFLDGVAVVEPSKANPCQYCNLHSLCRIHQLQNQSGQMVDEP